MNDLISRQALCEYALNQKDKSITPNDIMRFPSAQTALHYCRDCKWSRCRITLDNETFWRCLNWDVGTKEGGYCHEWERRTDGGLD